MMECPDCGSKISDNAYECPECGKEFDEEYLIDF